LVFIFTVIFNAASGIGTGTAATSFLTVFGGLIVLVVAIAAVAIAGFIMFMVAMHRLSNYYSEPAIFKNVLYGFILSIISTAVVGVIEVAFIFSSIANIFQATPSSTTPSFTVFILVYVVAFGVSLVFGIVNGWLYMRAFNKLKEKSGVDNFGTAGLLYLIGAIIPLVAWIAWIFAAMGFSKLKPTQTASPTAYNPTQQSAYSTIQTKRCPHCGAENAVDALYCRNCGKPQ
jgi:uncharacterized membrane protein